MIFPDTEGKADDRVKFRSLPDIGMLRAYISYDPESGHMYWLPRQWNDRFNKTDAGKRADKDGGNGYRGIYICSGKFNAHRIAWAIYYGEEPKGRIDHINGDKCDNRIANLRVVTAAENNLNTAKSRKNTSGQVGVCRYRGKWAAYLTIHRKKKWLGIFADIDDAIRARKAAEAQYGFHPNHGRDPNQPSGGGTFPVLANGAVIFPHALVSTR